MVIRVLVVTSYLAIVLAAGLAARRRGAGRGPEGAPSYYLAGRLLGPLAVLVTMAATNFSGFTVVGFAGAGYRTGLGFYPVMAFGTGLMAVSFALIGLPAHRLGRRYGWVTPAELIGARFGRGAAGLTACAMALFTLPYLAIQPMAAGYALEALLGLPYALGAATVTLVVVLYVFAGGLRSVVWTDFVQAVLMTVALVAGFVVVARAVGAAPFASLASRFPDLAARPGGDGSLVVGVWASYMVLWFLADPMLPQLFQRFYAARSERPIVISMVAYPVLTSVLFFFPVAIGALGRLLVPGLTGKDADRILPILMERLGGDWLAAIAGAGLIAGIMSTMDSQLLTLGSLVERDLLGRRRRGVRPQGGEDGGGVDRSPDGEGHGVHSSLRGPGSRLAGRAAIVVMAIGGWLLSIRPPASIQALATMAFAGLAVLFPVFFAAIHVRRVTPTGVIVAMLLGEAVIVLAHLGRLAVPGVLPVVPAVLVAAAVLCADAALSAARRSAVPSAPRAWGREVSSGLSLRERLGWTLLLGSFFVLSVDWWSFGQSGLSFGGFPSWLWYFVALAGLLAIALGVLGRRLLRYRDSEGAGVGMKSSSTTSRATR